MNEAKKNGVNPSMKRESKETSRVTKDIEEFENTSTLSHFVWNQNEMKKKTNVLITQNEHIKLLLYWQIDVWMLACLPKQFSLYICFRFFMVSVDYVRWNEMKKTNKQKQKIIE